MIQIKTMGGIATIRDRVPQEVFDYQTLLDCLRKYHKPRDGIQRLVAAGDIVRIRKGLYAFAAPFRRQPMVREQLANLIYGPSYVSLDSALSFHGLIPERVEAVTSVTTGRSRHFDTPFGTFSYQMLSLARYAASTMWLPQDAPLFLMASPEKALADKVWMDKRFAGTRVGDFGPYLLDDLRMAPQGLRALDAARLKAVGQAYDSPKIDNLLRFLHRLKHGENAE
jgi:hypothetical protein